ncbi:MAG TPA: BolA family protein [Xanthomonadales bacterium]|nr:BolA family protein [Xanthomonadales bacterium]
MMDTDQRITEMRRRLEQALNPEQLSIEDEGHMHVGHEGARDGRGHFRVMVISDAFEGLSMLQKHRAIYDALGDLMKTDIHALAIDAYSSSEL